MSTANVYLDSFAILDHASRNTNDHQSDPAVLRDDDVLVMQFAALPQSMQYKRLVSGSTLHINISNITDDLSSRNPRASLKFNYLLKLIDTDEATYNNSPEVIESVSSQHGWSVDSTGWYTKDTYTPYFALNCGMAVQQVYSGCSASIRTTGSTRPYLSVEVDDSETVGLVIDNCTPASGSISKRNETQFSWLSLIHI